MTRRKRRRKRGMYGESPGLRETMLFSCRGRECERDTWVSRLRQTDDQHWKRTLARVGSCSAPARLPGPEARMQAYQQEQSRFSVPVTYQHDDDSEYFIKKQRRWPVNKEYQTELCTEGNKIVQFEKVQNTRESIGEHKKKLLQNTRMHTEMQATH